MAESPTRREVMTSAVAIAATALMPGIEPARPGFLAINEKVNQAVMQFRQARIASRVARPRILDEMRNTGISGFFAAAEIRTRVRARQAAQEAVEELCRTIATNEREIALQEEAVAIYENELRGPMNLRNRFALIDGMVASATD
ncbi:hypothetical protein IVB46_41850 [Bradyrhizobium sp. 61]|uniref:hypothetical protein n=1 Tax=Bradyrhizobium sp. 61 TaxID=2782679 RepID=UPI001FFB3188|nr:hypothetical protein [Bradyrhizobium sp. 61]MCK1281779.1 hypothetical protein [Bradyrhizobium sp. 61]